MRYSLIQSKYRCHCGSGIYLGHRFYPQPFFLLQLAGKLRGEGHSVKLFDLFRNESNGYEEENVDAIVIGTGEYSADAQFQTHWMFSFSEHQIERYYSGAQAWLNRQSLPKSIKIIEPWEVLKSTPAWDLIDFTQYPKPEGRLRAVIRITIGCPNRCSFCPVPVVYSNRYFGIDIDWALTQLDYLYNERKIREFSVIDDNLLVDMKKSKELLNYMISKYPEAHFFLQEGIEVRQALDLELCKLLEQARFYNIRIGIETLNEAVLKKVNKPKYTADEAVQAVRNLQSVGFRDSVVFMMQGLSGNTSEQELRDVEIFNKLNVKVRNHKLISYQ